MCGAGLLKNKKQLYLITVLFTIFFILISAPWDFGFTFFADKLMAWWIHYILGAVLGVYTMWAFVRAIVMLLGHERHHIEGCNGES